MNGNIICNKKGWILLNHCHIQIGCLFNQVFPIPTVSVFRRPFVETTASICTVFKMAFFYLTTD